jgi:GNAT superfamily N-acetyltransferase
LLRPRTGALRILKTRPNHEIRKAEIIVTPMTSVATLVLEHHREPDLSSMRNLACPVADARYPLRVETPSSLPAGKSNTEILNRAMIREKIIQDRHGRALMFSQERTDGLVYFKLEFKKACAAYANCQIEDDVLVIADLFVQDQCVVRHPDFFRRLLGRKTLEVNFRKQGIGGQMLNTIIAYAKSKGFRRIEGRLAEKDLILNPKLPQWFAKRGFKVEAGRFFMALIKAPHDDSQYMPKD